MLKVVCYFQHDGKIIDNSEVVMIEVLDRGQSFDGGGFCMTVKLDDVNAKLKENFGVDINDSSSKELEAKIAWAVLEVFSQSDILIQIKGDKVRLSV